MKEILKEVHKERHEATIKAREDKIVKAENDQALEDSGLSRINISTPREVVEEIVEEVVEEIIEEEPEVEEKVEIVKEVKEIINEKVEELGSGKVQCPECKKFFTKGGAFVTHYKSHFNESE